MKVKLTRICAPKELQSRAGMNEALIDEYAEAMRAGAVFPPIDVFEDPNDPDILWLGGGFHRTPAAAKAGFDEIEANIHKGGKREALLFSLGENITHGLRRSAADKRKAVQTLLQDPEWAQWSDREIARKVGVDHKTVAAVRGELAPTGEFPSSKPTGELRKGRDGKLRRLPQATQIDPAKDPHTAFHAMFEAFIATVPEDRRHYVCGQLRTVAWEFDPEAQEQVDILQIEHLHKHRKH